MTARPIEYRLVWPVVVGLFALAVLLVPATVAMALEGRTIVALVLMVCAGGVIWASSFRLVYGAVLSRDGVIEFRGFLRRRYTTVEQVHRVTRGTRNGVLPWISLEFDTGQAVLYETQEGEALVHEIVAANDEIEIRGDWPTR